MYEATFIKLVTDDQNLETGLEIEMNITSIQDKRESAADAVIEEHEKMSEEMGKLVCGFIVGNGIC